MSDTRVTRTHLEKVGHAVQENESLCSGRSRQHSVVSKTHANEDDCKHGETHQLPSVRHPIVLT